MGFTLRPVDGEDFVDRDDSVEDMVATLSDKKSFMGFALYEKRRKSGGRAPEGFFTLGKRL